MGRKHLKDYVIQFLWGQESYPEIVKATDDDSAKESLLLKNPWLRESDILSVFEIETPLTI